MKRLVDQAEKKETLTTRTQLQLSNIQAQIIKAAEFKENKEIEMSMRTLSKAQNIHQQIRKWANKMVISWYEKR